MENLKLFYTFKDPLGAPDVKAGVTGHADVRLGVYQNSYSRNSHIACFDLVYVGDAKAINRLEKVIKTEFDWAIERDGRGASEWISNKTINDVAQSVDTLIEGYKFKVVRVPKKYLPLTVDNLEDFKEYCKKL